MDPLRVAPVDLVFRHARIADDAPLKDVAIKDGKIVAIVPKVLCNPAREIDAAGRVLIPGLIESLSAVFKLRPGDILITGTPAGVGAKMNPPRFLQPGDRIRMTITGLGETANAIVAA